MKLKILDSSRITIIIFIMITIIFCILSLLHIYETFCGDGIPEYLKHKGSCFSCEKQFIDMYGEDSAWRGQQSKMFSAEQQGVDMYGESGGSIGKSMKYY
jgi:hypothetical protein